MVSFRALGTTVSVLTTGPGAIARAERELRVQLDELERACSRFKPGSELSRALDMAGTPVVISAFLADLVAAAIEVARLTDGAVDPTVGTALDALGYDRDFKDVAKYGPPLVYKPAPAPGWQCIELDRRRHLLRVPEGVRIDLGSSAKAFAADRAARDISAKLRTGVLVNLGGDIAVAGEAPDDGWRVGLAPDAATAPEQVDVVVVVRSGGLASSGTAVRSWRRGARTLHHIIDPRTGEVANSPWTLVTVAAASCLVANAASTAAIVEGGNATTMLERLGLPARLVRSSGEAVRLCGWPAPDGAAA